jgi:tetratricopeptide (TPR) repeat protein
VTHTGTIVGTPGYLAPEQARAEREVDARADVFALGSVLYKCLAGAAPFEGATAMAVMAKILLEDPRPIRELRPEVSPPLADLLRRMLDKNPAARPHDGAAVEAALETLQAARSVVPVPPPTLPPASLGEAEQQLLSVVVVARDPSAAASADGALAPDVDATALRGASMERLADGSLVVVMACEGTATDQARRAARCALALRRGHAAPMALATGTGMVARSVPVGRVIDAAVALLRVASRAAGGVVTDEVTARLLGPRFSLSALGPSAGGGGSRPQAAWLLRGEDDAGDVGRTLLGRPTPIVGRERELGLLRSLCDECISERTAQVVLVTGAPGVGKSRLRAELCRELDARRPAPESWLARCDAMSAGSSFGVVAEWLRAAAGLSGAEPVEERRARLVERLEKNLPAGGASHVVEFLCEVAGLPLPDTGSAQLRAARRDAKLMGDQIRRAWEDFLAAECAVQPVVLVVEDLHWGDLPSVRLVDAALGHLYAAPLFVLATARPEVSEQFPGCWEERRLQRLALGQLRPRAAASLVEQVLGDAADAATTARIVEQAAGNALFLEELIRATAEGRGEEVPATVLAMLQARVEQLAPDLRRALRAASVFGEVFWCGGVASLVGETQERVAAWITELVDREVVARRGASRFPAEDEHVFRHALVREAAYATLTDEDRVLGHEIAGTWLHDAGERDPMVLAEHFERGAQAERAIAWYRRAAEQALEGNDLSGTISRARRATACGAAGTLLGELRMLEAEALEWQGAASAALLCAREAMRALPVGSTSWYRAVTVAVAMAGHAGDLPELQALVDELPGEPSPGAALAFQVTCGARAAVQLFMCGQRSLGDAVLDRALAFSATLTPPVEPAVRAWLAQAHGWQVYFDGDVAQSFRIDSAAAEAFMEAGDLRNACRQVANAGFEQMLLGAYAEAERILRDALAGADRLGILQVSALALLNLGLAVGRQGRLDEGLGLQARAIALAQRQGFRRMEGVARVYMGMLLAEVGDLAAAEEQTRTALGLVEVAPPNRPLALGVHAGVLLRLGRVRDALRAAEEACALIDSLESVDEGKVLARLALAEALHACGEQERACEVLAVARAAVLQGADHIDDPRQRQVFERCVPENARTLDRAAQWLDGLRARAD